MPNKSKGMVEVNDKSANFFVTFWGISHQLAFGAIFPTVLPNIHLSLEFLYLPRLPLTYLVLSRVCI